MKIVLIMINDSDNDTTYQLLIFSTTFATVRIVPLFNIWKVNSKQMCTWFGEDSKIPSLQTKELKKVMQEKPIVN